jgi:dolichol-phosphate mannosyltransferase
MGNNQNLNKKILLAVPVYNEEKYISEFLSKIHPYAKDILIIDDGSTDQSKIILSQRQDICLIAHTNNRGYGQSIIDAIHFAICCHFDWLITMDCDLQHEPEQIPDFIAAIQDDDADIISGSRYLDDSPAASCPPQDRKYINQIITDKINQTLGLPLTDAFCGFKACRTSALDKLALTETGYAFPLEFWVQAAFQKLRIREIPVKLIYNDPNRHFGGQLDNTDTRLNHYLHVFQENLKKTGSQ